MLDLCIFLTWFRRDYFFTGGSNIMDRDSNLSHTQQFEVKNILMMYCFLQTQLLASQFINWWTGVVWITCGLLWCFYQLFGLSFWRHPFTAEDPLLRQWCNATFLQIWWRNKLIYISDGLKVSTFSAIFHFCVNYPFKVRHLFEPLTIRVILRHMLLSLAAE